MKQKIEYICEHCDYKGIHISELAPYIKGATYGALIDCPRCKKPQIITIYV